MTGIPSKEAIASGENTSSSGRSTRTKPEETAGADPGDFARYWGNIWPYVIIGALFCVPILNWLTRLLERFSFGETILRFARSRLVAWIVSLVLAGLFWYAVYKLIQTGSDPMGYAAL